MAEKAKKEAKKRKLTPKRERFCQEYLIDFNITQSAIRAGFSKATAYSIGWTLLKDVEIQNRINELQLTSANQFNVTKQRLMSILMDIAGSKIEDIKDPETGAILPAHDWPEHMKGVISGIEVDELYEYLGTGMKTPIGQKVKVRLWEKTKAIELLNKMCGFNMPDKVAQTTPEGEAVAPIIQINIVPPKNDDDV